MALGSEQRDSKYSSSRSLCCMAPLLPISYLKSDSDLGKSVRLPLRLLDAVHMIDLRSPSVNLGVCRAGKF
eukprot:Nk52_evm12s343 gene=Nk52_evmTU12s343